MTLSASPPLFKAPLSPFANNSPLPLGEGPRVMPTVTDAPTRSPRVIRLLRRPDDAGVGVLCITNERGTQHYVFKEIRCDIGGRGFAVHRLGLAQLYHVRIDGRDSTCECKGFLSRGRCKHVQGLTALIGHGLL